MKTQKQKKDNRPRFGWCRDLDANPQKIQETVGNDFEGLVPVVVIPLPDKSRATQKMVREFVKSLHA